MLTWRRVDEEYEVNVASTIAALESTKYSAVRTAFEWGRAYLAQATPDTLGATRSLFEAAESLFMTVSGSNASLDSGEVRNALAKYVDKRMARADDVAKGAAARLNEGFADWVGAKHSENTNSELIAYFQEEWYASRETDDAEIENSMLGSGQRH